MENNTTSFYKLSLTNREMLEADGVIEVQNFDEQEVRAFSKLGILVIKGEGLHITQLNLDNGQLVLEGIITSVQYLDDKKGKMKARSKGIMEKLFK